MAQVCAARHGEHMRHGHVRYGRVRQSRTGKAEGHPSEYRAGKGPPQSGEFVPTIRIGPLQNIPFRYFLLGSLPGLPNNIPNGANDYYRRRPLFKRHMF